MKEILLAKPVLIGLHLGFAIVGIDAFFWLLGELMAERIKLFRARLAALIGFLGFALSWIAGGYYYVKFYGTLVKPVILGGLAPWAHAVAMEAKEHIFLFLVPIAGTILLFTFLPEDLINNPGIKKNLKILILFVIVIGLIIGALGFTISAAARWGTK